MDRLSNAVKAFRQSWIDHQNPREKMQVGKRQTRYNYRSGPMMFLGQQIVKQMQDSGYPAFIHCCLRTAEDQRAAKDRGASKAGPFQSPHQYWEAVDIVHPKLFWNASSEYWQALADCSRLVANKFGVTLELGFDWGWDSAHIELKDWRDFQLDVGQRHPTQEELDARFEAVLPEQWKQFRKSKAGMVLK